MFRAYFYFGCLCRPFDVGYTISVVVETSDSHVCSGDYLAYFEALLFEALHYSKCAL